MNKVCRVSGGFSSLGIDRCKIGRKICGRHHRRSGGPELGVGFRWNLEGKRTASLSALEATCTPKASGSYTATAVLPGFRPKTSQAVRVGPSPAEE